VITIATKYREELWKFLEKMGCKMVLSSDRHWQTEGEVEYPDRNGETRSASILREDDYYDHTYHLEIRSTPGFEQKLLVRARKWAITVPSKGTVKPFRVYYNPKN